MFPWVRPITLPSESKTGPPRSPMMEFAEIKTLTWSNLEVAELLSGSHPAYSRDLNLILTNL